jgi:hypothetical protein
MLHRDLDRLASVKNGLSRYLAQTVRPWIAYSMRTRNLPGCWIHDVVTVAWLLDPTMATTTEDYLDVSLEGITRGMTCRYGRDGLRLDVGFPSRKARQYASSKVSITPIFWRCSTLYSPLPHLAFRHRQEEYHGFAGRVLRRKNEYVGGYLIWRGRICFHLRYAKLAWLLFSAASSVWRESKVNRLALKPA